MTRRKTSGETAGPPTYASPEISDCFALDSSGQHERGEVGKGALAAVLSLSLPPNLSLGPSCTHARVPTLCPDFLAPCAFSGSCAIFASSLQAPEKPTRSQAFSYR